MGIFRAYFDESYNHPTEKEPDIPLVYTVGGYLSSAPQWIAFQRAWGKALKKAEIPYFHMADFESRLGVYQDWSNEKRINFLQTLHKIIHKYVLKGFTTSIVMSDYDNLTKRQKDEVFGEPHMCALFSCLKHIYKLCSELDLNEPIAYVFETNKQYDGLIDRAFGDMPNETRLGYRVGSLSFAQKDCMPLQASDILTYEVTKELANQLYETRNRPIRLSIKNLAVSRIDEWYYMRTEHFLEVLTSMKENGIYDGEI
jgi:hypothetical protein